MQRIDLGAFETLMQELAELFNRRPYSAAAIKHWFDALSEFSWDRVRNQITIWRDSKTKEPAIADILVPLRNAISDDIERRAAEDKNLKYKPLTPVTPYGEACMVKIRHLLANKPAPSKSWAIELRDRHRNGESLYFAQEQLARQALGPDWHAKQREPGEDDE